MDDQLDLYVLRQVCELLLRWKDVCLDKMEIALKFSRRTMERKDISGRVEQILREYPGVSAQIRIVVQDTKAVCDWKLFLDNCRKIAGTGLKLCVDRCGSEETENSLMLEPFFGAVRLDRELVDEINRRTMDYLTVKVITDMCRREGKEITADGITSYSQYESLKSLRCSQVQGSLVGEDMKPERFEAMYLEQRIEQNII